ncbi:sulfur carrier protein ThiS adenylyltransferase ThiF [bacterium]|nr:sulfur carrier protein ThiS adenylyltransferase ThiF [bacterium]
MFQRNHPILRRLQHFSIGIAGCGGLGSNAAVALVRAGIGKLTLVDFDTVELSNLNRQHYFQRDIGLAKVDALKNHLYAINPSVTLVTHNLKIDKDTITELFSSVDILIEAFDTVDAKMMLIEEWMTLFPDKPIVSGSGMAGVGNLDELRVRKMGNLYICGDEKRDMSEGFSAARVAIVANMQAETVISILTN